MIEPQDPIGNELLRRVADLVEQGSPDILIKDDPQYEEVRLAWMEFDQHVKAFPKEVPKGLDPTLHKATLEGLKSIRDVFRQALNTYGFIQRSKRVRELREEMGKDD